MDSLLTIVIPGAVGLLTAAGACIGLQFREVDSYERRRGVWQWLLVLFATVATFSAVGAASGVGSLLQPTLMAVAAAVAVIFAHVMWRRRVPDAEPRTRLQATAAAAAAVVVIAAGVTFSYFSAEGCRQADQLVQMSRASSGLILPAFDANKGPTVGDFDTWARLIREQAQQVTDGDVAQHTDRLAELAGKIAEAERDNDKASHAMLGAKYYDELKALLIKCYAQ